jgi:hypothetical protein
MFQASLTKIEKQPNAINICHYVLFSQIARLKKATGKRTFFCFSAALGTLHTDIVAAGDTS